MMRDRKSIAASAANTLGSSGPVRALVGFDGFVDAIIDVVDVRHDMTPGGYRRIATIGAFAQRCAAAAGKSANLELVTHEERFGGNGPLMASALGRAGADVEYIGAVGQHDAPAVLHPLYRAFAERCTRVVPVAPPARTEALEFDDGKLMLGSPANVQRVTWEVLVERVGVDGLIAALEGTSILGMVNWTMMAGVEGIWRGLIDEVLPRVRDTRRLRVFVDLADPAKRRDEDLRRGLGLLRELDGRVPVSLGLNLAEAERVARVVGVKPATTSDGRAVSDLATNIRAAIDLSCVVVHPRHGAAGALRLAGEVRSAWFDGPLVAKPKISTGAGDHFNAGFALGLACGMELEESLALGCASSGAYVRDGDAADRPRLCAFLRDLPEPEIMSLSEDGPA